MAEFLELLKQVGPIVGIIAFFIWRDYKREQAMTQRMQALEDYQREKFEALAVKTNALMQELVRTINEFIRVFRKRPCVAKDLESTKPLETIEHGD